nr:bifunctional 4-hydroxy-2-oxoglutarate aldolase/2-dehydro-3-deoxy-phosphogluconate aldolase [Campylobacter cuniculorum]
MKAREILGLSKIIPVITIEDASLSVDLAKALMDGGAKVLEITLRTKEALKAIESISKELPELVVGAGTILNAHQLELAIKAGAKFGISPGLNTIFATALKKFNLPFIPGIATAGELMLALEFGFDTLKFFPAQAAGGVNMLKSFSGPFKDIKFCPTGGISIDNMKEYLKLDNVICIGGSWLTPKELVLRKEWQKISQLTSQSLELTKDL